MSGYGKINIIGMLAMPAVATLTGVVMFGPRMDTIALWPTLVPAGIGIVWYLWDALIPAELDPGRVYIAGPQYLLAIACLTGITAWIFSVVVRSRRENS